MRGQASSSGVTTLAGARTVPADAVIDACPEEVASSFEEPFHSSGGSER